MFDCHIHTQFSTDSNMNIEDAIERASELNVGLIITEHMDLKYPVKEKFCFNVEKYFTDYKKYRCDKLLLGIEMGMRPDCITENKEIEKSFNFDYVIGSVHIVNGIDIYEKMYYENRTKKDAYEEYFKYMLDCVKAYDFIDSLGHIDYIARYAKFDDNEIYYKDFAQFIDEILKVLINNGKAIEINMRRLGDKNVADNLIKIYSRYRELGGKYVTIGSDSHSIEDIGKNQKVAEYIAENCGLSIVHFKERKMVFSK